jgi:hypothetical protein
VEKILHYRPHSDIFVNERNICTLMCQIKHILSSTPSSQSPLLILLCRAVALFTICGNLETSHSIPILISSSFYSWKSVYLSYLYIHFSPSGSLFKSKRKSTPSLTHFRLLPPISHLALIAFTNSQTNTQSFEPFHLVTIFIIYLSYSLACIQIVEQVIKFLSNTLTIYISQPTSLPSS